MAEDRVGLVNVRHLTDEQLAVALEAFIKHEHLGKATALRTAIEALAPE